MLHLIQGDAVAQICAISIFLGSLITELIVIATLTLVGGVSSDGEITFYKVYLIFKFIGQGTMPFCRIL